MKIIDNTIVEATETEIHKYWADYWSDLFNYTEFFNRISTQVKIVKEN